MMVSVSGGVESVAIPLLMDVLSYSSYLCKVLEACPSQSHFWWMCSPIKLFKRIYFKNNSRNPTSDGCALLCQSNRKQNESKGSQSHFWWMCSPMSENLRIKWSRIVSQSHFWWMCSPIAQVRKWWLIAGSQSHFWWMCSPIYQRNLPSGDYWCRNPTSDGCALLFKMYTYKQYMLYVAIPLLMDVLSYTLRLGLKALKLSQSHFWWMCSPIFV